MNDTTASLEAAADVPPKSVDAPAVSPRVHRGRLFRKYLLLILTLVTIALLASGAISLYFTYQETKSSLASLQHEKALAAASRIEQYIRQIERQITFAALPQLDTGDLETRRIEFLKLLRQAPEITDIAEVDGAGREQIAVSRLGMDALRSNKDRSQEPAFRDAKRGQPYFGPVYFRKETEPYMTIAVRSGGDKSPVTIADVNLKFVWDVVSRIKIGESGKAYVVDANGFLVADPDIGLVLRKTNLSGLPHVQSAKQLAGGEDLAIVSRNFEGKEVLASLAPIESLNWNVFVEQPVAEVYRKLNASILRTALLLLVGLGLSAIGAWALARGMVRPIRTLEEGAQKIGAGDLDQTIAIRTGDELESLADGFNRMSAQLKESYAGLERKVDERTQALQNALEQQTAISEILRVISSSPTDVQPVLDAVAERAALLCDSTFARVLLVDGDALRTAANYSTTETDQAAESLPRPLKRSTINGRVVLDRATIHLADVVPLLETEFPDARPNVLMGGHRAVLAVPLMRERDAYGSIIVFRRTPGLFSPDRVALVETFARQAAIAIDNVRLFNETKRALEQQTAISEILRVISSSPTDVKPMLNAVAERALTLCDAAQSGIFLVDDDTMRFAAGVGRMLSPDVDTSFPLTRKLVIGRAAIDRQTIHLPDIVPLLDTEYPDARPNQQRYGFRALLAVPLMREDRAIGSIALWRSEPRPFTDKQIALVRTFADQAAIAINNVRLFNETKEALEQQTAVAEILRVISGSPTDVKPVLNAIAERAAHLCDASSASMYLTEGDQLHHLASKGPAETVSNLTAFPINRESISGRAILERTTMHIADMLAVADEYPLSAEIARRYGHRTVVVMPLFREGQPFGTIVLRRLDVRSFTDREVELLRTFGDQAAIALENVRLFNETKEALEQQRAAGEVLTAISSSIADTKPVFDKILQSCEQLFAGRTVVINLVGEDGLMHLAAYRGPGREEFEKIFPVPVDEETGSGAAIVRRSVVHVPDVESDEDAPPKARIGCRAIGVKAAIFSPLMWEGKGIGAIFVGRDHVGRFSDKDIALLKTFADQAVIAIQNARLFTETKEALERQTGTAEVLRAISRTTFELQPVLEMLIENSTRMCKAENGHVYLRDGDVYRWTASHGAPPEFIEWMKHHPIRADEGSAAGRAALRRQAVQIDDVLADPAYARREAAERLGFRTILAVPMLREGDPVGIIAVWRDEVRPFAQRDIDLVSSFADQAVIAIENVRLFNETKEALEQQRASGEVLSAISSSIADTAPVFDKILDSCERLFSGTLVQINLIGDDGLVRLAGYHGPFRETIEPIFPFPVDDNSATGLAITTRSVGHYPDIENMDGVPPVARNGWTTMGVKAAIVAPMLWEARGIGSVLVGRDYAGPFSEKEITLLKTFADQAVIAIQNARLFNETKEALDQQRASAEVLAAISSSIADTAPVFQKIVESCERLFAGKVISINMLGADGRVYRAAYHGPDEAKLNQITSGLDERETGTWAAIERRDILHYPDIANDVAVPRGIRLGSAAVGVKSGIVAPMIWENKGIGAVMVGRDYAGPFTEKEIGLLKTFANQAVIAIQNARLFREIQEKSRELEVANKHKSEFLANMSHELRTPLNAIIGFSEVLLERFFGEVNEKQEDYLKDIHSSGKHLLSLINDILDLSKVEAGRMELEPVYFDVSSALSNALTLIRERAQRHGITLGQDVDPKLGEIYADERKFKQILLNLLSNAVKFTPDGGQINVSACKKDSHAVIAVRDTGIGIAAADQSAVFEEFRQVGHDYTRKAEGTGLGLALTRKFVELHGGRIWVDSEPGKGSTFTFTIPLREQKTALH